MGELYQGQFINGNFLAVILHYIYFKGCSIPLFLERGEGREKENERNINVWLPLARPQMGTWPTTQACALTGTEPVTLWFTGQCSIH